ncbi:peroxin [Ophidiomyces ophidiicola]|nr:peroxin [Ophidiomyces ophidiicola]KAI1924318.1 peroxin [Ophidiomyces ophidiicola]KAI1954379.1 peroxin [Ophidiomyces ophidiicola]KAI1975526.1 peroxin [Ophidiomyces ophidiicola]KAI1984620.1 peroxin [Ophidiomyces ophidiicola]
MISATKRWLRRNRNGLAIGAGVIGVGYLATQYIFSKISEASERMSSERIARDNLRRRFEQNQTDCTFTVLALLPTATENILGALPVEELTNELQMKRAARLAKLTGSEVQGSEMSSGSPSMTEDDVSSLRSDNYVHASQMMGESTAREQEKKSRSRIQLWNDLKINCGYYYYLPSLSPKLTVSALTRSFTLLYTLSLLTLLTRIQLNLLGRRNYLSSVVALAAPSQNPSKISLEDDDKPEHAFGNDFETNRRYLTFSWWLLHMGWKDLMEEVEAAVKAVFGEMNPREDMSHEKLSELTLAVRKRVEGNTSEERQVRKWLPYLLPPREKEDFVLQESGVLSATEATPQSAASLRRLIDETSDLIDSPSFTHVFSLLNNEAFSYLIDTKCATEAFNNPPQAPKHDPSQPFSSTATMISVTESSALKAKLASILAVVARQAHLIGNGINPPNEYLSIMEREVRELEAFAAVIYSSNFDLSPADPHLDPKVMPGIPLADPEDGDTSINILQ